MALTLTNASVANSLRLKPNSLSFARPARP